MCLQCIKGQGEMKAKTMCNIVLNVPLLNENYSNTSSPMTLKLILYAITNNKTL